MYPEDPDPSSKKRVKLSSQPSAERNAAGLANESTTPDGLDRSAANTGSSTTPAIRARNRAAAWRYRHKIQTQIQELEAKEAEVTLKHRSLVASLDQLREGVFDLKNMVFKHAHCDFPPIQHYLSIEMGQTWIPQVQNELGAGPSSFPGTG